MARNKTNTEEAISVVLRYLGKVRPSSAWRTRSFEQEVYTKWAYMEILDYLKNNPDIPPLISLDEFKRKMDEYACKNTEASIMFSIAYDACETIIDALV